MNCARLVVWLPLGLPMLVPMGCSTTPSEPPPERPGTGRVLGLGLRPQETAVWCWAASGEMCMDFLGADVSQCGQATARVLSTSGLAVDCCTGDPACVTTGWPDFGAFGFVCKETQQPEHYAKELSWAEVVGQVEANKPVAFSWEWAGGGGHMLVLYGYHTDADGVGWVSVHDPLPVNQGLTEDMTYDTYVAKPGEYQHWKDFYDIGKAGVGWRLETPIWIDGQRDRTIAPLAALAVLAYAPRGAALSDDRAPSEQPVRDPVPAAPLLQPASAPDQVAQLARAAVLAAQPAAPSGVRSLKVEARRRFAELGFNSIEEARAAILGDGLAVLRIRLDDLKAFQPVQSVFDLLRTAPDQVIWSVTSSFRVCSSVTTDLRDGKWTATRYGAANRIAGIAGARAVLRQHNAGAPPAAEYIISVPALNVMLVAHQDAGGSVVVAPTADHPSLALDSKKAEPVVDVLTRLVAGANNVNATCPG